MNSKQAIPLRRDIPAAGAGAGSLWASDAIAEMIRALDIPYVLLNPGSSFRGLHDSLVNHLGNIDPQMLVVLHEEHAVAIAHGYAKVAGKPLAAIVHSNVGLMHAERIGHAGAQRTSGRESPAHPGGQDGHRAAPVEPSINLGMNPSSPRGLPRRVASS